MAHRVELKGNPRRGLASLHYPSVPFSLDLVMPLLLPSSTSFPLHRKNTKSISATSSATLWDWRKRLFGRNLLSFLWHGALFVFLSSERWFIQYHKKETTSGRLTSVYTIPTVKESLEAKKPQRKLVFSPVPSFRIKSIGRVKLRHFS